MKTSEVLNKAADLIEKRGWGQGQGVVPPLDAHCAVTAIGAAAQGPGEGSAARAAVREYLGVPLLVENTVAWNDAPGRTKEEVIEVLRSAALIELAKETADQLEKVAV